MFWSQPEVERYVAERVQTYRDEAERQRRLRRAPAERRSLRAHVAAGLRALAARLDDAPEPLARCGAGQQLGSA